MTPPSVAEAAVGGCDPASPEPRVDEQAYHDLLRAAEAAVSGDAVDEEEPQAWVTHKESCGAWASRAEAVAWGGGTTLTRLGGALTSTASSTPQSTSRRSTEYTAPLPLASAEGGEAELAAAEDAFKRALSGGGAGTGVRLLRILLDGRVLGSVEVALDSDITLFDLRKTIVADQIQGVPQEFCFLLNGGPVSEPQEKRWLAANCLPALDIADVNADGFWNLFGFFGYLFGSASPRPHSPDPAVTAPARWSSGPLSARAAPTEPPALLAAQWAAPASPSHAAPRAQHTDDILSHSRRSSSSTTPIPSVATHGGRSEGTYWITGPRRASAAGEPQRFDLTERDIDEEDNNFFPANWRASRVSPKSASADDGAPPRTES